MYVVMQKQINDGWRFPELSDIGTVPEYPTRTAAESRAAELGGTLNDMHVVPASEADEYGQFGCPRDRRS